MTTITNPYPATIINYLTQIRQNLTSALVELTITNDPIELGEALTVLALIKADLRLVHDDVESKLLEAMGETSEVIASGKYLRRVTATPRKKWNHDGLRSMVMDRLLQLATDQNTGEVNLTPRDAVDRMSEYAHVDYWRAGALQGIDVNPDKFCELGDEKVAIRIEDY